MKAQTLAPLALAAAAEGLNILAGVDINLPLGIEVDLLARTGKKPTKGPCDDCTNVYHPPHHGIDMDECDNDQDDDWHWVHPGKPHYPEQPNYTWGTSTVTCSETSTIIGCPPDYDDCPGEESTVYTTVTEIESTTICPVPVETTSEYHEPPKETYVPVEPTTSAHYPPISTTTIAPETYECPESTTLVTHPPKSYSSVYVPAPPAETPVYPPPAEETTVWVPPTDTPEYPVAPPADDQPPMAETPEYPSAPPADEYPPVDTPEYPVPDTEYPDYVPPPVETPVETPVVPGPVEPVPPPPVTAGAAQTAHRLGGAAFAMIAAALL